MTQAKKDRLERLTEKEKAELEKLQKRKKKAETLHFSDLEKHFAVYLNICKRIDELNGDFENDCYLDMATYIIIKGLLYEYGAQINKVVDSNVVVYYILNEIKKGDFKFIYALTEYLCKFKD